MMSHSGSIRNRAVMNAVTQGTPYWDPYDPEFFADPYPSFRRLREEAPIYYNEKYG